MPLLLRPPVSLLLLLSLRGITDSYIVLWVGSIERLGRRQGQLDFFGRVSCFFWIRFLLQTNNTPLLNLFVEEEKPCIQDIINLFFSSPFSRIARSIRHAISCSLTYSSLRKPEFHNDCNPNKRAHDDFTSGLD